MADTLSRRRLVLFQNYCCTVHKSLFRSLDVVRGTDHVPFLLYIYFDIFIIFLTFTVGLDLELIPLHKWSQPGRHTAKLGSFV